MSLEGKLIESNISIKGDVLLLEQGWRGGGGVKFWDLYGVSYIFDLWLDFVHWKKESLTDISLVI